MTLRAVPASPLVAIDVRLMGYTGIGTYLRALVPRVIASRPDWRFVLVGAPSGDPITLLASERVTLVPCTAGIYTIAEQLVVPPRVSRGTSVFWSPHYNIPVLSRAPLVVTVHDVCHLALPEVFGGVAKGAYARWMFAAVRRRAQQVIFVSDFSRQEFCRLVGEPVRATTIHSGVDPVWHMTRSTNEAAPHPRPYLLAVGGPRPHKNLGALVRGFEQLLDRIPHDLVIIGDRNAPRVRDEDFLARAARLAPRVHLIDRVSDEMLKQFMSHAAMLVFPSLYEGFGLPALEAMATGCPCVVSSAASLPEICGDAAAYCDPHDPADIAAQIRRVLTSAPERDRLVRAGRAHALRFNWDVTAHQTAAVLDAAVYRRHTAAVPSVA